METKAFDASKVATLPAWLGPLRLGSELPLAVGDALDAGATEFPGENSSLHSSFRESSSPTLFVTDMVRQEKVSVTSSWVTVDVMVVMVWTVYARIDVLV